MKQQLVLFDFDGTLTRSDSFPVFIRFAKGSIRLYSGLLLLSPLLVLYKLRLMPNWKAKELVLTYFFKGADASFFQEIAKNFSLTMIPKMLRQQAYDKMQWHIAQQHRVIVVSSSIEDWLRPWCQTEGVELIASRMELRQDKLTGKLEGKNCYGTEKARRIRELLDPEAFDTVYAYGNSRGDREMLEMADQKFFKTF